MKRLFVLLLLALGLLLASCGGDGSLGVTPSPTATHIAQPVTMESDVHSYDTAHFGVYFVEYQTLVRDTAADFTSVEWDCFPPQLPDHPHAFFGVNVGRQNGTVSYDGHTLRLVPHAGSAEVGTINADGTWSMLETETSLHFMYRVATGSPEGLVKRYDGASCTPEP